MNPAGFELHIVGEINPVRYGVQIGNTAGGGGLHTAGLEDPLEHSQKCTLAAPSLIITNTATWVHRGELIDIPGISSLCTACLSNRRRQDANGEPRTMCILRRVFACYFLLFSWNKTEKSLGMFTYSVCPKLSLLISCFGCCFCRM